MSRPSSRTRRAIVSSSNTMRANSRPPVCFRLAVLGNIHPHVRGSGLREVGGAPADPGNPEYGFAAGDHRVRGPDAPRHVRFHQQSPHGTMANPSEREYPVPGTWRADLPVHARDPGGPRSALDPRGRCGPTPPQAELAEHCGTLLRPGDHRPGDPPAFTEHAQPIERRLRHPPSLTTEWDPTP